MPDALLVARETHHRVKNHLQNVASFLGLEARRMADPQVRAILEDSRNRVVTIALLQDLLARRPADSLVRLDLLFEKIARAVVSLACLAVSLELDLDEITVSEEVAARIGQILSEVLTNSLRHAFVGRPEPRISVTLRRDATELRLEVQDNGGGCPCPPTPSLGVHLIEEIAAGLAASIQWDGSNGVRFTMCLTIKL